MILEPKRVQRVHAHGDAAQLVPQSWTGDKVKTVRVQPAEAKSFCPRGDNRKKTHTVQLMSHFK